VVELVTEGQKPRERHGDRRGREQLQANRHNGHVPEIGVPPEPRQVNLAIANTDRTGRAEKRFSVFPNPSLQSFSILGSRCGWAMSQAGIRSA